MMILKIYFSDYYYYYLVIKFMFLVSEIIYDFQLKMHPICL